MLHKALSRIDSPQKLKGGYRCPEKLKELISLVNVLPDDCQGILQSLVKECDYVAGFTSKGPEIEDFEAGWAYYESPTRNRVIHQSRSQTVIGEEYWTWDDFEHHFINQARKAIGNPEISDFLERSWDRLHLTLWEHFVRAFEDLISAKLIFQVIATASDEEIQNSKQLLDQFRTPSGLKFTKAGYVKPALNYLFSIFDEADIYFGNIRLCKICGSIFWAKREKAKACSPRCRVAFVNRVYRRTNRERINRQRRENYRYKNKATKGEK